jgi:hypothetical protein
MVKRANFHAFTMEMASSRAYSSGMELMIIAGGLVVLAVASQVWGVDSRPGLGDGRLDRKESWFPR